MKAKEVEERLTEIKASKDGTCHVNIDADPLVYRIGFSSQKETFKLTDGKNIMSTANTRAGVLGQDFKQWTDDQLTVQGLAVEREVKVDDWHEVEHRILGHIQSIIHNTSALTWTLYLTGSGNWRNEVATIRKYKAGRGSKPELYGKIREYLEKELGAVVIDGMEADDALAIASWEGLRIMKADGVKGLDNRVDQTRTVLASIDKDLRQVPGLYYNPAWEGEIPPQKVDKMGLVALNAKRKLEFTGLKGFYAQILLGDSCDAIPGVKGCGPVFVEKLLMYCSTEEELFFAVYDTIRNKLGETLTYYHWQDWVDPDAPPTKKSIKKGAKPRTVTALEYMTEIGNLLYMLRKPPVYDDVTGELKLPWKAPRKFLPQDREKYVSLSK